jgi:hypothetical protein
VPDVAEVKNLGYQVTLDAKEFEQIKEALEAHIVSLKEGLKLQSFLGLLSKFRGAR